MNTVEAAGIRIPPDLREAITGRRDSVAPTRASEARNFQRMCSQLEGGSDLYLFYRQLSGESHALSALSRFLVPTKGGGLAQVRNPTAVDGTKFQLACITAYSLTWGLRAYVEVLLHKPNKQAIRNAAQRLGIPSMLTRQT
jgi:hypothetical protein